MAQSKSSSLKNDERERKKRERDPVIVINDCNRPMGTSVWTIFYVGRTFLRCSRISHSLILWLWLSSDASFSLVCHRHWHRWWRCRWSIWLLLSFSFSIPFQVCYLQARFGSFNRWRGPCTMIRPCPMSIHNIQSATDQSMVLELMSHREDESNVQTVYIFSIDFRMFSLWHRNLFSHLSSEWMT